MHPIHLHYTLPMYTLITDLKFIPIYLTAQSVRAPKQNSVCRGFKSHSGQLSIVTSYFKESFSS